VTSLTLSELSACGARQRGHFQLSSGLHSSDYLQCAIYLAHPERSGPAGRLLADSLVPPLSRPDLIVAPALGGLIIGHETARALGVPSLFTERVDGRMALRRGFGIGPGQTMVVVEDVVTTGRSTREVIEILEGLGGVVLGVGALVNRSGRKDPFGALAFHPLLEVEFPTWEPAECPLCRQGLPIEKPGSRPVA